MAQNNSYREFSYSSGLPRPGSMLYTLMSSDPDKVQNSLKKYKLMNKYLTLPLYKIGLLPLLGFGRIFLILTTIGRKTGKKRKTPLEYRRFEGILHIFAARGRKADWFQNLKVNPNEVWIRIGFRSSLVKSEILKDQLIKKQIFNEYVKKYPRAAKALFGWDRKVDDPEITDFSNLINLIEIIRLHEI
ncbi:MAG: nitroreductase family deazaflavin-dependent oxidoreductase [Candidatus Hermodarchaeota archaeon]